MTSTWGPEGTGKRANSRKTPTGFEVGASQRTDEWTIGQVVISVLDVAWHRYLRRRNFCACVSCSSSNLMSSCIWRRKVGLFDRRGRRTTAGGQQDEKNQFLRESFWGVFCCKRPSSDVFVLIKKAFFFLFFLKKTTILVQSFRWFWKKPPLMPECIYNFIQKYLLVFFLSSSC